MNKNFVRYQLTSKKYLIVFLTIIQLLSSFVAFTISDFGTLSKGALSFGLSFAILMIATIVMTPLFFSFLHNKKSIDAYYSLPLSRKSLFLNTIISLIGILFISWLFPTIITFLMMLVALDELLLAFVGLLIYILIIFMIIAGLVFFYGTVFLLANNFFDGIVMIIAYMLLPLFLAFAVAIFQDTFVCGYNPFDLTVFGYLSMPFMACNMFFESMNFIFREHMEYISLFNRQNLDMFIFLIEAIIFGIALYITFTSHKAESVEQKSDGVFAYPSLIYIYTFIFLFILTSGVTFNTNYLGSAKSIFSSSIVYLFVFIFFMIAHFVYRRKIYINMRMIVFFALTILFASSFSSIAYQTRGFGFSDNYIKDHENVLFTLYTSSPAFEDQELVDELKNDLMEKIEYKEGYDFDYLNITIEIDMDREDIKNNPKLYKYIDDWRKMMIDEYYQYDLNANVCDEYCSWLNFGVSDRDDKNNYLKSFNYSTNHFFVSKDFSDELFKYDNIIVMVDGYTIPLTESIE